MRHRFLVTCAASLLLSGCILQPGYIAEDPMDDDSAKLGQKIPTIIRYSNFRVDPQNATVIWVQNNTHEKFIELEAVDATGSRTVKYTGQTYNYSSILTANQCSIADAKNWECADVKMIDGELTRTGWQNLTQTGRKELPQKFRKSCKLSLW